MMLTFQVILLLSLFWSSYGNESLVITIGQGKLQGLQLTSRNGTTHRAFLAIPYAEPPVGELRFQSPQKPSSWTGIRDATNLPPECVQKDVFTVRASSSPVEGQEDCLYLNVYTPNKTNKDSNLPVLVYIHGGGYLTGSGNDYFPDYFLDYNIILVTLNYRLGPFGFLSTADTILPGNYGMKDQAAALKWINENIINFGGDPQKVTIFGESAGAASVHFHLYSALSKGLFQRAISHSGTAFAPWASISPEKIREKTLAIGVLAGCPIDSSENLVKCLRKIPAKELMLIHHKLYTWNMEPCMHLTMVPEPEEVPDAFLLNSLWKEKPINNVPWITGITSGEGVIKAAVFLSNNNDMIKELNENYERLLPMVLLLHPWLRYEERAPVAQALKKFYIGEDELSFKTRAGLIDMMTDVAFMYNCLESVSKHSKTATTYLYYYDHRNILSFGDLFGNCSLDLGVSHVDDLISLFHFPKFSFKVTESPDLEVSRRMVERWVNFASTGDPSIDGSAWKPFKSNEENYLHISTKYDEMKTSLLPHRFSFMKDLMSNLTDFATIRAKLRDEL